MVNLAFYTVTWGCAVLYMYRPIDHSCISKYLQTFFYLYVMAYDYSVAKTPGNALTPFQHK